ncbi:MAG: hypothetical protein ACOCXT_06425 [Candidatus Dojkabacteria bacterium]
MNTTVAISPDILDLLNYLAKKRNKNKKEIVELCIRKEYQEELKKKVGGQNDMFEDVVADKQFKYDLSGISFDPNEHDEVMAYDDDELLRKALRID